MAVESALSKAKPELMSIEEGAVRPMSQSYSATISEALRVWHLWERFDAKLKAVKPNVALATSIPTRISVLEQAQTGVLERARPVKTDQEKTLVADAEKLRKEFYELFEWAFRDGSRDADLKRIREGEGVVDMVADLQAMVELAGEESARLSFEKGLKDMCKRATAIGEDLQKVFLDRMTTKTDTAATNLRDRAATWLELAVREVREAGRYAFRDDADQAAAFSPPSRRSPKKPVTPSVPAVPAS